jgi:kynurenine formamidase
VLAWEARHGRIQPHSLVVANTGWHAKFAQPAQYLNLDSDHVMHFPGYSRAAAVLLVERDVAGVGIDTLSIDPGNAADFAAHKVILAANRYQIENLANLDALPATGAVAVIGVLPVREGSQAQARVFALLPDNTTRDAVPAR